MKTPETIEGQADRKSTRDNDPHSSRELTPSVKPKLKQRDASRIAAWRWQPGKSANPGGVPKHGDVARDLARAIFENNPELVYKAFVKALAKGSAYAFQVLADRGYGKLTESIQHQISPYHDVSDEELCERIRQLEQELGIPSSAPEALPPASGPNGSKPN